MRSIVVFNNKGGVGKTTLLCNLAANLKLKKNKKVLVIDTDPQCNATTYLFSERIVDSIYERNDGTIFDIMRPVQRGRGYIKESSLPILSTSNFGVDVIAGDPRLSLAEDFLGKDWIEGRSGDPRGLQTTLVFKDLLLKLKNYDFVIFDVGPSLGALNRAILIASDYFIIPMSSDIFSLKALENISTALDEWKEGLITGLNEYERKEGEDFEVNGELVDWNLKFIGYVTQQYTAKTINDEKRPVNAYEKIIKKIPSIMKREMSSFSPNYENLTAKLGEIPSLHSLVPLSQNAKKPIFGLLARDGVVGAHFNKVREYDAVIDSIVDKMLNNIAESDD